MSTFDDYTVHDVARMELGATILELQYLAQRNEEVVQRISRAYQRAWLSSGAQDVYRGADFGERGK